jgi:hypothetical protein
MFDPAQMRRAQSSATYNHPRKREEESMFNSPLHYCKVCKQYVALDRPVEECASDHACKAQSCPSADLFCEPAPTQEEQHAKDDKPVRP